GWAAYAHAVRLERDRELLEEVFRHGSMAQEYFDAHGWDLAKVERVLLERWVEKHTGFPEFFGPDYPEKCEKELLEQARAEGESGDAESARGTIDLLRKLIPPNAATFDRLARLAWTQGDINEAARLLAEWSSQEPANATPLLRLAVVEIARGNADTA